MFEGVPNWPTPARIAGCGVNALSGLRSATVVGLIRRASVASGIGTIAGCGVNALSGLHSATV